MAKKNLTLCLKESDFNDLIAGKKKTETRDIIPSNVVRYCHLDEEGFAIVKDGLIQPKVYDTITFYINPCTKKEPRTVVEVVDSEIRMYVDENGNFYREKDKKGVEYYPAAIVFELGEIIEKVLLK